MGKRFIYYGYYFDYMNNYEVAEGYKRTEESKRKQSESISGEKHHLFGKHPTKETIQKQRESHLNNPNKVFKDTKIELKMEAELKRRNINYEKQYPLCKVARVDFYLPEYKIVIQCDGCYWHNCLIHYPTYHIDKRKIDRKKDAILTSNGYKIYRFWEHEINKNVEECVEKLKINI